MVFPQNQCRSNGLVVRCSNIWIKTLEMLQQTKNLNTFQHNLKGHYLKGLKNFSSRWALFALSQLFILNIKVCNIFFHSSLYVVSVNRYYSTFLRDHNVNKRNLMQILCYPSISESVISLSILTDINFLIYFFYHLLF